MKIRLCHCLLTSCKKKLLGVLPLLVVKLYGIQTGPIADDSPSVLGIVLPHIVYSVMAVSRLILSRLTHG